MQVLVNTDSNIEGRQKLTDNVTSVVEAALERFSDQITRVEVHLGDENSHKGGENDKRCMMEARPEGRPPTAVTHHANSVEDAVDGAAEKLKSALERTFGRLRDS